jgi:hypothetical protein
MSARISAILFIFICACGAWWLLGGSMSSRTDDQDSLLKQKVSGLWGSAQRQVAPEVTYQQRTENRVQVLRGKETVTETNVVMETRTAHIDQSAITVDLKLEPRKKGLLWYSTYRVFFDATYQVTNVTGEAHDYCVNFAFPSSEAVYDSFAVWLDGHEVTAVTPENGSISPVFNLADKQSARVRVRYASQGMDNWWYSFGKSISSVRDFTLLMTTDFKNINFPDNSMSPTDKQSGDTGWKLTWRYSSLLSGTQIGMEMPRKLNPGPFVARVSFFAPVSLFLFFFLLFMICVTRNIKIHSMNFFFLAAAFFSFHLLLAYLVDHIDVYLAMLIASATSIFLVVSYMRLVVGARFALVEVGLSQFVYLILFSYAFFLEGYTGLTITVCCIATLAVLMFTTGRIDWESKFKRSGNNAAPTPTHLPPPPPPDEPLKWDSQEA